MRKTLGNLIFAIRWILYPVNIALVIALALYIVAFLHEEYDFIRNHLTWNVESYMIVLMGFFDASMVASLAVMIIQGGHQIFINRFPGVDKKDMPQYLEHIDTGILKIKIALSIAGITLIHVLKDFFNLEQSDWTTVVHRILIHGVALLSALIMALIWRVTHPKHEHQPEHT